MLLGVLALALASCVHRSQRRPNSEVSHLPSGWPKATQRPAESEYGILHVEYPQIPDAEFIRDDELCATCHETYTKTFAHNVHHRQSCEDCHGPASRHLSTRGREPGLIFEFKKLAPATASEVCLKCHEQDACSPGAEWRTSVHAHEGVSCTDCHRAHYSVPPGTPATTLAGKAAALPDNLAAMVLRSQSPETDARTGPALTDLLVSALETADGHRPLSGPHVSPSGALPRTNSHHLGAVTPQVCYRCHQEMQDLQAVAHPHQVGGPNGLNCTSCHDPHGRILEYSRTQLCLQCHNGPPTGAWHGSTHHLHGVGCTDCHDPHPSSHVQPIIDIRHTDTRRPKRLPMSVGEPDVCYKCHTDIYGRAAMPSHHPIREGKMVCSDCHDGHGQFKGNLREATVNQVCYRCHAEVQGPFVYEHPPVTEDCTICHQPHGTVENNLLRQPTTFLCLRCHSGHRSGPAFHDAALLPDIGTNADLQRAFFSDCTQCHSQIHGSDVPSPHNPHALVR